MLLYMPCSAHDNGVDINKQLNETTTKI